MEPIDVAITKTANPTQIHVNLGLADQKDRRPVKARQAVQSVIKYMTKGSIF